MNEMPIWGWVLVVVCSGPVMWGIISISIAKWKNRLTKEEKQIYQKVRNKNFYLHIQTTSNTTYYDEDRILRRLVEKNLLRYEYDGCVYTYYVK